MIEAISMLDFVNAFTSKSLIKIILDSLYIMQEEFSETVAKNKPKYIL
jgi:hypothetical protein